MEDSRLNWYVLFVMGGQEYSLCRFLNSQYQDWSVFFPEKEMIHKKQGKQVLVKKALFPSYIFIESTLDQTEMQRRLKEMRRLKDGIIKELRYGIGIPALQDEEIRYLTTLMDEQHIVKKSVGYIEHDKVVIIDGPLSGYESKIIKIDRHQRKALMRVMLLGREIDVSVSLEIVKR